MGPATGMTNAALVEHYSNCIKLSAENVGQLVYFYYTINFLTTTTINPLPYLKENQHEKCLQLATY